MPQHDMVISDQSHTNFRADVNAALAALVALNSGASEPATKYAYMLWADTTTGLLKIRNAANDAWITVGTLANAYLGLLTLATAQTITAQHTFNPGAAGAPFILGANAKGQLAVGLVTAMRGYIFGLILSNNAGDATNDIDIATGECSSDDAAAADRVLLNPGAMTKQLDAEWAAGTAAGGRIAGEGLADGTWHVYAFRRTGGTDDYCFSQSLTPTLPDSGSKKRRIGSIIRASAAILTFSQNGNEYLLKDPPLDVNSTNPGTAAVTATLTVPSGIKVNALYNCVAGNNASGGTIMYISSLDVNDEVPVNNAGPLGQSFSATGSMVAIGHTGNVRSNTSSQIRYRISTSDATTVVRISTLGWIDTRGGLA